jgi:hypothetical protein
MFNKGMLLSQGGDALPKLRLFWKMFEHGQDTRIP